MKEANENLNDSVKLLSGTYMSIDDYNERNENKTNNSNPFEGLDDVVEIGENFLD